MTGNTLKPESDFSRTSLTGFAFVLKKKWKVNFSGADFKQTEKHPVSFFNLKMKFKIAVFLSLN